MGFDMNAIARTIVWSSTSTDLPEDKRRRVFLLHYYSEPLPR